MLGIRCRFPVRAVRLTERRSPGFDLRFVCFLLLLFGIITACCAFACDYGSPPLFAVVGVASVAELLSTFSEQVRDGCCLRWSQNLPDRVFSVGNTRGCAHPVSLLAISGSEA